MKKSSNNLGIGIAVTIILGTIGWLAFAGYDQSKQYLVHIPELVSMGDKVYTRHLRVDGFVKPGSIEQNGPNVTFLMNEYESHSPKAPSGKILKVIYKGTEPPPDTFKDDSQAVAIGSYGRDGVFHANELQAKCASKYAPTGPNGQPGKAPGMAPANPSGNPRASLTPPAKVETASAATY